MMTDVTITPAAYDTPTGDELRNLAQKVNSQTTTPQDAQYLQQAARSFDILHELLMRQRRELDELLEEVAQLKGEC